MPSKPLPPILEELFQIDRLYPDTEEQYRRWLLLRQQHLQGDKILAADLNVAAMMTLTGTRIAQQQERYQDALDLFTALSAHPRFAKIDPGLLVSVYSGQMLCYLRLNDEAQAAAVGYRLLKQGAKKGKWSVNHLNMLCLALMTYVVCSKSGKDDDEATEEFMRLVVDTVGTVDPNVPTALLSERATYRQLRPLVMRAIQKVQADQENTQEAHYKAQWDRLKKNGFRCHCGHRLTRRDLLEQTTYVPEYYGAGKVIVTFQCSHCQQKSQFSVRQEEWQESLLDANENTTPEDNEHRK